MKNSLKHLEMWHCFSFIIICGNGDNFLRGWMPNGPSTASSRRPLEDIGKDDSKAYVFILPMPSCSSWYWVSWYIVDISWDRHESRVRAGTRRFRDHILSLQGGSFIWCVRPGVRVISHLVRIRAKLFELSVFELNSASLSLKRRKLLQFKVAIIRHN